MWPDRASAAAGAERGRASAARQRGSLLVELMLVAALALALAVWGGHEWAERTRTLQARALALWMASARTAAEAFLERHAEALAHAQTPDALAAEGYVHWSEPDWTELRAAGLLPADWQPAGPLGQSLGLRILRAGACPQVPCQLQALVHTRGALTRRHGSLDEALVAEWLLAAEGRGLVIWPHQPRILAGAGRRIPLPAEIPDGAWPAGTLALSAERLQGSVSPDEPAAGIDTEDFLRVRDARDPDFQGDATVQGTLRGGADVVARNRLVLESDWVRGTVCAPEGALGRERAQVGLLQCRQGVWRLLARPSGGGYLLNSRRGCFSALGQSTANPVTGSCSCAAGFNVLQVSESGALNAPEGLTTGYLCHAH